MNATYSAEVRALGSTASGTVPLPGPAEPARKEVRPSSGKFWASFAKSAKAKMPSFPGVKKKVWSPKAPPPPPNPRAGRAETKAKPPRNANNRGARGGGGRAPGTGQAPPPFKPIGSSLTPPEDMTMSLADVGRVMFHREGSAGSNHSAFSGDGYVSDLPIADVTAELPSTNSGLFSFSNTPQSRVGSIDLRPSGDRPPPPPGSPSYFDRDSHAARRSWGRDRSLDNVVRESSFMTLNSEGSNSSFLGARQSMNQGGQLTPRDSRTWMNTGAFDPSLTHDRDLQFPPDFRWDSTLGGDAGDGMDMS